MAETVKIPGIKGPVKKQYLYIGGAAVGGIAIYAYWSRSRAEDTEITDYTTEPDYVQDGSVDEYENPGGSEDPVEVDDYVKPKTNAQWAQEVVERLGMIGFKEDTVADAIGLYLTRQYLSIAQAGIIRTAIGLVGFPPEGSYPIQTTPTPGTKPPVPPVVKPPVVKPPVKPPVKPKPIVARPVPVTGKYVTVTKFPSKYGTLWDIAEASYGKGKGFWWPRIWANSRNAAIRSKRKQPNKIEPGDRIWVPGRLGE